MLSKDDCGPGKRKVMVVFFRRRSGTWDGKLDEVFTTSLSTECGHCENNFLSVSESTLTLVKLVL